MEKARLNSGKLVLQCAADLSSFLKRYLSKYPLLLLPILDKKERKPVSSTVSFEVYKSLVKSSDDTRGAHYIQPDFLDWISEAPQLREPCEKVWTGDTWKFKKQ